MGQLLSGHINAGMFVGATATYPALGADFGDTSEGVGVAPLVSGSARPPKCTLSLLSLVPPLMLVLGWTAGFIADVHFTVFC